MQKSAKKDLFTLIQNNGCETVEIESITQLLSGYDNAFFASFIVSILIIASGRLHLRYSARGQEDLEVQKSHEDPTPRIGVWQYWPGVLMAGMK